MAWPVTVGNADLKWPELGKHNVGPFKNGTDLYVVLCDRTNSKVEVWKSTDGGDTWAEQDSANEPTLSANTFYRTATCDVDGTTIYVAYCSSTNAINIKPFDMSTDAWGTNITGGPTPQVFGGVNAPWHFCRRSDGSYVLFYQGATESIMGTAYTRIKLHYYASGAWNGPYDVKGSANSPPANTLPGTKINYYPHQMVKGASDRVHMFWGESGADISVDPTKINHRTFTSGNVFITASQTDVDAPGPGWSSSGAESMCYATTYVDGGTTKLRIPYRTLNGFGTIPNKYGYGSLIRADSADTLTLALESGGVSGIGHAPPNTAGWGTVVEESVNLHYLWNMASSAYDMYYDSDGGVGTFGDDVMVQDNASASAGIRATLYAAADIAVIYDEGGTVKFLRYAPVTATPKMQPFEGIYYPI